MERMLDKKEAAAFLNVSQRTVDYFRVKGNLPFHIVGGASGKLVRFFESELRDWVTGRSSGNDNNDKDKEEGNAKT